MSKKDWESERRHRHRCGGQRGFRGGFGHGFGQGHGYNQQQMEQYFHQHMESHFKEFRRFKKMLKFVPFIFLFVNIVIIYVVYRMSQMELPIFLLVGLFTVLILKEIASIAFSFRMRRRIMTPIESLKNGLDQIAKGNYGYTVQGHNKSMVGGLIKSFNSMSIELKEAKEVEQRYENNRKELIAGISHDLKTPMTSIIGYLDGIKEGVADSPEKLNKYLDIISANASYTNNLIDDLFLMSKLDLNQMTYHFEELNALDYFTDVFLEKKLQLEDQGAELDFSCIMDQDVKILLDVKMVYRVITNIIQNALKYNDKETPILNVNINMVGEQIELKIQDNGPGMEEEQLSKIFQVFYRGDASRNKEIGGSGLGLSIAKQLIEAHGGSIWAESECGVGTTIGFTLNAHIEKEL